MGGTLLSAAAVPSPSALALAFLRRPLHATEGRRGYHGLPTTSTPPPRPPPNPSFCYCHRCSTVDPAGQPAVACLVRRAVASTRPPFAAALPPGRRFLACPFYSSCPRSASLVLRAPRYSWPWGARPRRPPPPLSVPPPSPPLNAMSSSHTAGGGGVGGGSAWGATVWADDDEWEDVDAVAAVATTAAAAAVAIPASTTEAPPAVAGSAAAAAAAPPPPPPSRDGAGPGEAAARGGDDGGGGDGSGGVALLPPAAVADDTVCRGRGVCHVREGGMGRVRPGWYRGVPACGVAVLGLSGRRCAVVWGPSPLRGGVLRGGGGV